VLRAEFKKCDQIISLISFIVKIFKFLLLYDVDLEVFDIAHSCRLCYVIICDMFRCDVFECDRSAENGEAAGARALNFQRGKMPLQI